MDPFVCINPAQTFISAPDCISEIGAQLDKLAIARALLVVTPSARRSHVFEAVRAAMGERCVGVFADIVQHSDVMLVEKGAALAKELGIDGLVALGGGSSSDTAKGIAILIAEGGPIDQHASRFVYPDKFYPKELPRPKLPILAVPTTASAAEVTPGLGIRDVSGEKLLFWDTKLASRVIFLDPKANLEVPAKIMATTGMNGFAHCAEGLYSRLRNPISEALALKGARLFARALPAMVEEPDNMDHRADVLSAAALSGLVISNARVGIHHAVCHCLGARGKLPHGEANSIMLPHALTYNLHAATAELAGLAEAMGVSRAGKSDAFAAEAAIDAVRSLQARTRVPTRLRDTGLDRNLLPAIAQDTLKDRGLYFNPKVTHSVDPIIALLEQAW